jgi:type VI secretion system protein ImpA
MSVIDVDALLTELSAEAPAGADLEYDPGIMELETLARGTPEAVMGDKIKPAEEPEWPAVKDAATALFEKTRDLRVAMILATALLKTDGVAGFRDGTALVRGFVERLWDHFYPKLDPDDNNDPTVRVNILKGFDGDGSAADLYKFKQRLREAILTNSKQRIGAFSYRDIQIATGELPPPPQKDGQEVKPPDMALINAAFEDTSTEDLIDTQTALQDALDQLKATDAALAEKAGPGIGPDLTAINDVLKQLKGTIDGQLGKRGIGEAPAPSVDGGDAGGSASDGGFSGGAGGARAGVALSGEISSRADVLRVLDKICEYYDQFEPASPVPIFMKRAKKLVTMSFVDVIRELAPEAMSKIDLYTGTSSDAPPPSA